MPMTTYRVTKIAYRHTHAHNHTSTHARTHTHTHARTHTHIHTHAQQRVKMCTRACACVRTCGAELANQLKKKCRRRVADVRLPSKRASLGRCVAAVCQHATRRLLTHAQVGTNRKQTCARACTPLHAIHASSCACTHTSPYNARLTAPSLADLHDNAPNAHVVKRFCIVEALVGSLYDNFAITLNVNIRGLRTKSSPHINQHTHVSSPSVQKQIGCTDEREGGGAWQRWGCGLGRLRGTACTSNAAA